MDASKVCPHCKREKFTWQFDANKRRADGLSEYCKECKRALDKRHRNTPRRMARCDKYVLYIVKHG